jgi:hypothetical protein
MCGSRVDEDPVVGVKPGDDRRAGDPVRLDEEGLDQERCGDRRRDRGGKVD